MSILSYFRPKDGLLGSFQCPCNKAVEKAIVNKGLGKKRDQYFILMVASEAASLFVLFYARGLELLK